MSVIVTGTVVRPIKLILGRVALRETEKNFVLTLSTIPSSMMVMSVQAVLPSPLGSKMRSTTFSTYSLPARGRRRRRRRGKRRSLKETVNALWA